MSAWQVKLARPAGEFRDSPDRSDLGGVAFSSIETAALTIRQSFEAWITAAPYERDIERWPMDETKYAWPGQYKDIAVQLAWEAWRATAKTNYENDSV